jgi:hypothetical protein
LLADAAIAADHQPDPADKSDARNRKDREAAK